MCYDSAEKRYRYGAPEHDHNHPTLIWPVTKWIPIPGFGISPSIWPNRVGISTWRWGRISSRNVVALF
jgi:hypothetical protein